MAPWIDAARAAIELEKPRLAALRGRFLRDQFRRKIEVELADVHVRECTPAVQWTRWSAEAPAASRRVVGEDRPERLIEIHAVSQKRPVQDAFLRRAELLQRAVAAAVLERRARLEPMHADARRTRNRARAPAASVKRPLPQCSAPSAKPHSAMSNPGWSARTWNRPTTVSLSLSVMPNANDCPASRCRCVQAMNFSNPSSVGGGGEIRRVTSGEPNAASSAGASEARSSRSDNGRSLKNGQAGAPVAGGDVGVG